MREVKRRRSLCRVIAECRMKGIRMTRPHHKDKSFVPKLMLNFVMAPYLHTCPQIGITPTTNRANREIHFTTRSVVNRETKNDHQPRLHSGSSMAWRFFEHCGCCTERTWSFFLETLIHPHRLNSVHLRDC